MPRFIGAVLLSLCLFACADEKRSQGLHDAGTQGRADAAMHDTMHARDAAVHQDAAGMTSTMQDAGTHARDPDAVGHDAGGHTDAGPEIHDSGISIDAGSAHDAGAAGAPPDIVFEDPLFFDLPINSFRYGVSGHDTATDLCISVIWYPPDIQHTRHCSDDADPVVPYVVVEPGKPAGCWQYGGSAELLAQRGCVDVGKLETHDDDSVDLDVDVHSDLWSGTVRFVSSP